MGHSAATLLALYPLHPSIVILSESRETVPLIKQNLIFGDGLYFIIHTGTSFSGGILITKPTFSLGNLYFNSINRNLKI